MSLLSTAQILLVSAIAFCFSPLVSLGQSQAELKSPPMSGIAHVAIRVKDLSKSRSFYQALGYEEAFALDKGGAPTEAFFKVNDRQFIELYPQREAGQEIGFLHVCFESKDLEALNQFYQSHNLHPTPVRRAGAGNLLFTMSGPEHQNIEFTQYMPGSKHTLDISKHLGAHRISQQILGVGIPMEDQAKAAQFYVAQMAFPHEGSSTTFFIPGESQEHIEILSKAKGNRLYLVLGVASLKDTMRSLRNIGVSASGEKRRVTIEDPDGNVLEFVRH